MVYDTAAVHLNSQKVTLPPQDLHKIEHWGGEWRMEIIKALERNILLLLK